MHRVTTYTTNTTLCALLICLLALTPAYPVVAEEEVASTGGGEVESTAEGHQEEEVVEAEEEDTQPPPQPDPEATDDEDDREVANGDQDDTEQSEARADLDGAHSSDVVDDVTSATTAPDTGADTEEEPSSTIGAAASQGDGDDTEAPTQSAELPETTAASTTPSTTTDGGDEEHTGSVDDEAPAALSTGTAARGTSTAPAKEGGDESSTTTEGDTAPTAGTTTVPAEEYAANAASNTAAPPTEPDSAHEGGDDPGTDAESSGGEVTRSTDDAPAGTLAATSSTSTLSTATASATATTTSLNAASSSEGGGAVTIQSGQAVALANILNVINTNLVNSDGAVFFANFIEAVAGAIDLRGLYDSLAAVACTLTSCAGEETTVTFQNDGTIDNSLFLEAQTGENTINGAGDATIESGNAYAGLNLVNIANMNFVDSEYLLVTINAFDDVNGDIVFPSAGNYLDAVTKTSTAASLEVENDGSVQNAVDVVAQTGENSLGDVASGTIHSGEATAATNVFNELNSTLVGGSNITILFRVHGTWAGELFGAPDDLAWIEAPDGSIFLFDTGPSEGAVGGGSTSISGTNRASINNTVQVAALTGKNAITDADTALISSGNAYAGANIVNVANGSVVGRNWILAIINIFGDFNGNLAFGRPDLWIGERIEAPEKPRRGDQLTYHYTVINNGDSPATNVEVVDRFAADHLELGDASAPFTRRGDQLVWQLGKIPAGGAVELSYEARVAAGGRTEITNQVAVRARETDNNPADNTDTATIMTAARSQGTQVTRTSVRKATVAMETAVDEAVNTADALVVERSADTLLAHTNAPRVRQSLVLFNPTDQVLTDVVYHDVLRGPDGAVVRDEVWTLGDILPGEEITLGYNIRFGQETAGGKYQLASVIDFNGAAARVYPNGTVWFAALERPLAPSLAVRDLAAPALPSANQALPPTAPPAPADEWPSTDVVGATVTPPVSPIETRVAAAPAPASTAQVEATTLWGRVVSYLSNVAASIVAVLALH